MEKRKVITLMSSMMLSAVFLTAAKTQTVAADSVESANSEKVTDNTVQASNKGAEAKQAAINTAQASNREVKVKQDIKAGQVPDEAVTHYYARWHIQQVQDIFQKKKKNGA
ncbi:hypothetical protein F5ESL0233_04310 [Lactobacillus sp. ESL0233]|uniref:hypothetical protein n=1 Tax=Lactobacillus sp. ESL0233 TaxID=2069354 RepID=UPI000EFCDADD|nr:hypothetical protein [Lactobacillus sp. ESL0233]RMC41554.1 hypothetical protein F5ESL0233_04310 [Lactobacillus sp. ESL0233]